MIYFKNYGRLKGFLSFLESLRPTLRMMAELDIAQYGLRGRMRDGEPFYGEGRAEPDIKFTDWTFWRPGFEDGSVINILGEHSKYQFGRIRIMRCVPYHCYSWHKDTTPRLHIPLVTSRGAMIAVNTEVRNLNAGHLWWVDTRFPHSAFNGSEEDRYHIVYEIEE
jgi:hypothetical protein